jgi:hypothetical protein
MSMRNRRALLALVGLIGAAGCREDPERAEATAPDARPAMWPGRFAPAPAPDPDRPLGGMTPAGPPEAAPPPGPAIRGDAAPVPPPGREAAPAPARQPVPARPPEAEARRERSPSPSTAAPSAASSVGAPWGMSFADVQGRGVRIERIDIRSFAMPMLEAGDVVTRIDDRRVTTSAQLESYLSMLEPGSLVVVTVQRDDLTHYVMLDVPDAGE